MDDEHLEVTLARRAFFKKMAALAFAVPVVSSFTLETGAFATTRDKPDGLTTHGYNQTIEPFPGLFGYNQTIENWPPPEPYPLSDIFPGQYGYNQSRMGI